MDVAHIPGIQPRIVKRIFKSRQQVQPSLSNTVKGGKMMAMIKRIMSPPSIVKWWEWDWDWEWGWGGGVGLEARKEVVQDSTQEEKEEQQDRRATPPQEVF
jgi:hypothetical protein